MYLPLTLMTFALFLGKRDRINKINATNSIDAAPATFHTTALSIDSLFLRLSILHRYFYILLHR